MVDCGGDDDGESGGGSPAAGGGADVAPGVAAVPAHEPMPTWRVDDLASMRAAADDMKAEFDKLLTDVHRFSEFHYTFDQASSRAFIREVRRAAACLRRIN